MAKRDLSKTFQDMESEDLSLETTVPTDLSLTLSPDELSDHTHTHNRRRTHNKYLLERKQLAHDLQVVKIELSQKSLMIDNLKADHMQKVDDLEEKLSDALHQKNLLQAKLESQLKIEQEEARRQQHQIQQELSAILKRQQQLERTNERLQEKAIDIRRSLQDLELSEGRYHQLKAHNEAELTLKDIVAVKLYEAVLPWKHENREMKTRVRSLGDELHKCCTELQNCKDALEEEKQVHARLQIQHQKLALAYADTKAQVQNDNYKIENYDRVKRRHDDLERELADLNKQHGYLVAAHDTAINERDATRAELSAAKQTTVLLQQDKEFFSKQASDLQNRLLHSDDRLTQVTENLERTKQAREELYDKYVASRDQYRMDYEAKLRDELEQIRLRTNTEIDRLKHACHETYERENRSLREARDMALAERDRALATEQDHSTKYEQLMHEYRRLQTSNDCRLGELQSDVKLKAFEQERTSMMYEETTRALKEAQLNTEKLQKKLEVLTKEYYGLQMSMERQVSELESALSERTQKLESYERLENELDNVIMQAAEVEDEADAERVLFSYGYGANVPTTSKRRLKQSVDLARRVLQLERANTSLRKEVDHERTQLKDYSEKLKSSEDLLSQSHQPYHYLVETIRGKDEQLRREKSRTELLEDKQQRLQTELDNITRSRNMMAADLERLLGHSEELAYIKDTVRKLGAAPKTNSKRAALETKTALIESLLGKKGSSHGHKPVTFQTSRDVPVKMMPETGDMPDNMPAPTVFTAPEHADWYKQLKQKQHGRVKNAGLHPSMST